MSNHLVELQRIDVEISTILKSAFEKAANKKNADRSIKRKLESMRKARTELIDSLDQIIVRRYEKLRGNKTNMCAVVPIKNKICQGCFIGISTAVYVEIQRKDVISTCDHCGCFIYLEH